MERGGRAAGDPARGLPADRGRGRSPRRRSGGSASRPSSAAIPPSGRRRTRPLPGSTSASSCTSANAPAAVVSELASCGGEVLALTRRRRRCGWGWRGRGRGSPTTPSWNASPSSAASSTTSSSSTRRRRPDLLALASRSQAEGGYLHRVWGEAEWRFALSAAAAQLAQRPTLIAAFRDLRDAGEASGEELREALVGSAPQARSAGDRRSLFPRACRARAWCRESPPLAAGRWGSYPQRGQIWSARRHIAPTALAIEEARQYLEAHRQP